jgi:hypothetical protein
VVFFNKKVKACIMDTGSRLLSFKKQELEAKARDLETCTWIPMMIFFGTMNATVFASMMSFMGMAMNPVEEAAAGDAANTDTQDAADTQSEAADDNSGAGDAGGGGINTEELSGFDSGNDNLECDFEF